MFIHVSLYHHARRTSTDFLKFWHIVLTFASIRIKTPFMKKKLPILLAPIIALFASACCCQSNESAACPQATQAPVKDACAPKRLFDANLGNADYNKSVWSVDKDGVMRATKDEIIFTKRDYKNFELELEFRIEKESNSGVVIYCSDTKNWIPNSIEIQIADSSSRAFGKPYWNCACIFGLVNSEFDTRLSYGQWHKMKIRAVGQKIDVWLNGRHASSMDMSKWTDNDKNPDGSTILPWLRARKKAELPTVGKIGFQGKHGGASTDFRNIFIKEL